MSEVRYGVRPQEVTEETMRAWFLESVDLVEGASKRGGVEHQHQHQSSKKRHNCREEEDRRRVDR